MHTNGGAPSKIEAHTTDRALTDLRADIDRVDQSLLAALAARFRLAEEVGSLKSDAGILTLDPRREAQIVRNACQVARENNIPEEGVRQIFWAVIDCCREGVRSRNQAGSGHAPATSSPGTARG